MRQIFIQSRKDEYLTFTTSLLYIRHLTCTFSHLILMTTQEVGTGRMLVSWMWRQRLRGIRSFPGLGRAGVWLQFSDFRDPVFHTMRSASCVCLPCARPCVQHCHMQTSSRSTSCGPVAIPLTCSDFTEWSFPLRSAVTEAAIGGNSGKASWPRISHCHYLALWLYHSLSTASPNFGFHIGQRRRFLPSLPAPTFYYSCDSQGVWCEEKRGPLVTRQPVPTSPMLPWWWWKLGWWDYQLLLIAYKSSRSLSLSCLLSPSYSLILLRTVERYALLHLQCPWSSHSRKESNWRWRPAVPLNSCVTLGRLLGFSGPPFPHLENEGDGIVIPV